MVDYYRILEVSRTATSGDIKKAYRKLALRWHPDKNPDSPDEANKRFKEISEAYEVLIDDKKRRVYDEYGKDGLQMPGSKRRHDEDEFDHHFSGTFVFRDPEDVFRDFFGGTPFEQLFGFPGHVRTSNRHSHPSNNSLSTQDLFGGSFFGPCFSLHSPLQSMLVGDFTAFSSFGGNVGGTSAGGGSVKRTSTSTRFINGKKITTKKVFENGKETIMSYENDILKSKTVNGVPQSIKYEEASTSRQSNERIGDSTPINQSTKIGSSPDLIKSTRIKTQNHHPHAKYDKAKKK